MNRVAFPAAALIAAILLTTLADAQSPPEFEVASIKPTPQDVDSGTSDLLPGGRFRATNKTVQWLMRAALGISNDQILGGPDWVRTESFDIDAKTGTPANMTPELLKPLLLRLLADRFKLRFHAETRQGPVYFLSAERNKPKLKAHTGDSGPSMSNSATDGKMTFKATRVSMPDFASFLTGQLHRPVIDHTGISGEFDFALEWAPDQNPDSSVASVFTAIREELGLKLESGKGPLGIAVIDSIEKPSEN
jgi:uncharacterized protein (TIGR03435 family)